MDEKGMRKANREVKDTGELKDILRRCTVGRVAFFDGDYPYIVPMNFGFSFEQKLTVYFHCAREGKKLDLLRKNPHICFEADCAHQLKTGEAACDYSMNYESIIGWGKAEIVSDPAEKIFGLDCLMGQYGRTEGLAYKPEILEITTVIKAELHRISGKRLQK